MGIIANTTGVNMKVFQKTFIPIMLILLLGFSSSFAGQVSTPHEFEANTKAVAAEVNENFGAVQSAVNDNDSRIAALETAVAALLTRVTDLETENAALRADTTAIQTTNANQDTSITANASDIADAQVDLSDLYSLNLNTRVTAVENNTVLALDGTLTAGTDGNGYPAAFLTGFNLHIRNGENDTRTVNGTGNLIIGYNELRGSGDDRTGSHNLVVGRGHSYSSYGGQVIGSWNTISGAHASVSAGTYNQATGPNSSVSGGRGNRASSSASSVSGGNLNSATEYSSSVAGGNRCVASGRFSIVGGGSSVNASSDYSTAMGGWLNNVIGEYASVFGGSRNGCTDNTDDGIDDCAGSTSGASGIYSTVVGGYAGTASGSMSVVIGGSGIVEASVYGLANPHHP